MVLVFDLGVSGYDQRHSQGGARGRQEPLQAALPTRCFQLVSQEGEDGVGAPQTHAVHHDSLHRGQLSLMEENTSEIKAQQINSPLPQVF